MLFFGDHNCIAVDNTTTKIYNFSSMLEGFERICIYPPTDISYNEEKGFDIAYAEYLMNNDIAFYEFFGKIVMNIYEGWNVYIIVSREIGFEVIEESLQKFLQQRYSIKSYIINNTTDFLMDDYAIKDSSDFSINGLFNLDKDKERFTQLYANKNMSNN